MLEYSRWEGSGVPSEYYRKSLSTHREPHGFLKTKRADRNASEYHLNHCHMEKGLSKTHSRLLPAAMFQHIVLNVNKNYESSIRALLGVMNNQ